MKSCCLRSRASENGGAISPQFPILVMIDVLYSHFSRPTASARRLYMNTPSPNSMNVIPAAAAYLFFLRKRCRDFFCLLLGVYVALITRHRLSDPFFTGISCPGCGMSAVLLMLSGHFQAAFGCIRCSCRAARRCLALLRAGTGGTSAFKRDHYACRTASRRLCLPRIYYHDPLFLLTPLGRVLQWFYLN